ncbi:serine/arginine repetitive matrix protein 4 isoform X2 [Crotalus tigris]|uniref:serine/arginine repetitive matrix protein 4 isoform X2 n=1 Tax=Crotalus tigris TaxID=88082 RepID=UPI00192F65DD|nr:serine/arginine repetitive matrix protein 4 isoform X2 [Crotalus tigris]
MASLQQGEKQLFEKFWEGTFRAVATPRLGSIIMTKITSRAKPLASTDVRSCLPLPTEVTPSGESHPAGETRNVNGCERQKNSLEDYTQKSHSPSWDAESSPPPSKGKKKKKKSARKKRRRSPSYSVSPPKKKKKKKSSKKRKRNRISSKKKRHSSSSPKRKRKEGRKHKKHSRSRPQKSRRHRYRSSSNSTNSQSESCGSRHRLRSQLQDKGGKGRLGRSRHASKRTSHSDEAGELAGSPFLGCTLQNNYFLSTAELISNSGSATGLFKKATGQLGNQSKETRDVHEYDSGNATSSPPSVQTSTSRSKGSQETKGEACNGFGQAFSSGKASSVSSPDSGNSLHSYSSQSKGQALEEPSPSPGHLCKDQNGGSWPSLEPLGKKKANVISPPFSSSPLQPCLRNESPSSRSSLDSESLHHKLGRRSSPSPSCCSSKSSSSPKSCKRTAGSRNSRSQRSSSYSRYRTGRGCEQDHSYGSSGKESHRHQDRRRRKECYSPMRKRRRNSPSHLEARRITSARKRPIPYYRPSPSSSSPSSSSVYSSEYSCLSYSPARSRSYSSDRSSCSRSWSSYAKSSQSRSSRGRSRPRSSSRSSSASVGSYDSLRRS